MESAYREELVSNTLCGGGNVHLWRDKTTSRFTTDFVDLQFDGDGESATVAEQRQISAIDVEERKIFVSKQRHPAISKETLSERWNIWLIQAKQTMQMTTQRDERSAILPLSRRYRTDRMYNKKKLRGQKIHTHTLFGRFKSISKTIRARKYLRMSPIL